MNEYIWTTYINSKIDFEKNGPSPIRDYYRYPYTYMEYII